MLFMILTHAMYPALSLPAACEAGCANVTVARKGACEDGCVCDTSYAPVCGTNNVTYSNGECQHINLLALGSSAGFYLSFPHIDSYHP
jgi:hypothetical protein